MSYEVSHRQYSATLIRLPIRSNFNSIFRKKIIYIDIYEKKNRISSRNILSSA